MNIYGFTTNCRHLYMSRFAAQVKYNGIYYGEVFGFMIYGDKLIVIHDPINRTTHKLPMNDYTNHEGDFVSFLGHVMGTEYERRTSDN